MCLLPPRLELHEGRLPSSCFLMPTLGTGTWKMLNKYLFTETQGLIQERCILRIKVQKRQISCQNQGNEESYLARKRIPQGAVS